MSFIKFGRVAFVFLLHALLVARCSDVQEKLIKNLFKSYNKLIRPVRNSSDHVVITMDLVLLQLINVYEKEQIMKTNVWINLRWTDFQLNWTTNDYKVGSFRVPYDRVWTPDIVLFNNADGNYEASYKPNVVVYADVQDGPDNTNILWIPPAIYKSSCTIDVKYFPFDEQQCEMRFGSWTFDALQVRLKQEKPMVNLEDYLPSGTWDIIEVPGKEVDFVDANRMELVYTFKIRRKTLFYTVNLIIPTVLISFLSIFVFYLPTDEGEKMTLCISILLALVVFLLLVSKILPPTSMVIPLISKYLIFTLLMNIVTIVYTVIIINYNYRTPRTHNMPQWIRVFVIGYMPRLLFMKRPKHIKQEDPAAANSVHVLKRASKKLAAEFERQSASARKADLCSIQREDVSIPIIKSNSINFANSESGQQQPQLQLQPQSQYASRMHPAICNQRHHQQQTSTSSLPRPKQHQHDKLDSTTVSTGQMGAKARHPHIYAFTPPVNVRSLSHKPRVVLFQEDSDNDNPVNYESDRASQIQLNAVDSIVSVKSNNKNPTTTSILTKNKNRTSPFNNNNNNNSYNIDNISQTSTLLQRRLIKTNPAQHNESRRFQFSSSQSKSHEAGLNDSFTFSDTDRPVEFSPEIMEAADKVTYITNHIKSENYYEEMREDWKYVALVFDRLLLIIFFSVTVIGTALILFNAPHIFEFVDQQDILNKLIKANHF